MTVNQDSVDLSEVDPSEAHLLRTSVRDFCARDLSVADVLDHDGSGIDSRAIWQRATRELDLAAISIPVEYGGAGAPQGLQAVVSEELGRALAGIPYLSTIGLCTNVLQASGDVAAMERHLPTIADGRTIAALAVEEPSGTATTANFVGGQYRLSGRKEFVIDGHHADLFLITAKVSDVTALFAVSADSSGVDVHPSASLDLTRLQSSVTFHDVPALLVGDVGQGDAYLATAMDAANALIAAEQVGGIDRCLALSVSYAAQRTQFGRKIGSFQAIKHRCVDVLVGLEMSRALTKDAVAAGPERRRVAAAAARLYSTEAYRRAAAETIHIHGGTGFTWEHEAHLHFRRAYANASIHGRLSAMREVIAQDCLAGGSANVGQNSA